MKVTLQRVVFNDVDILLDKTLKNSASAESFFFTVASNLVAKHYKQTSHVSSNGRQFIYFRFNDKKYILSLY